ncbi:MAG: type I restriction enzyme HsdR N-terminal domain-containing protein [Oscillospiraceae bacterium]
MITIPTKAKERLTTGVKRFQAIIAKARDKDINESDTVTIIADILSDLFGYDKYTEITSEYAIKKTFCDLAVQLDESPCFLIEAKAVGINLKDQQIRQAVDYGANSGIEWVLLTNTVNWKVYKIIFAKPIDMELVYEFDFLQLNPKRQSDLEMLFYLSKESMIKSSKITLADYYAQKQILNRFTFGQILLSESVLDVIKRQVKKMSPTSKLTSEEIAQILADEVIKREVLDGESAADAKKKVSKAMKPAAVPKAKIKPGPEEAQPSDTEVVGGAEE